MTPKMAADVVRAVESIVGQQDGLSTCLDDGGGCCTAMVVVRCGANDRSVIVEFGNLRGGSVRAEAEEADLLLLRKELGRDEGKSIWAGQGEQVPATEVRS